MNQSSVPGGDPYVQSDAAYVLGALSAAERRDYEAHLLVCERCRAALEEVTAVLPGLAASDESLLDEVSAETPAAPPPIPDTVLTGLLATAERDRRRGRLLVTGLGGLAAASLVTAAVLGSMALGARGPTALSSAGPLTSPPAGANSSVARPMTPLGNAPVTAEVALQPTEWGTEIDLTCWYRASATVPTGYRYVLMVRDTRGSTYQLGSWELGAGSRVRFTSGTALSLDQISAIDVTDGYGSRLLTLTK